MKTETYLCQGCGESVERPVARGQKPKWCPECRRKLGTRVRSIQCAHCGVDCMTWREGRYCSRACHSASQVKPKPAKSKRDPLTAEQREARRLASRSDIRAGFEDQDWARLADGIRSRTERVGDCWRWSGRIKDGYPVTNINGRWYAVHRLALMAKHGADLGSQHAHHVCANTECVNPAHLQPVTHRENVAEMLARQSYLARIRELESALAQHAPQHPLLAVISVA